MNTYSYTVLNMIHGYWGNEGRTTKSEQKKVTKKNQMKSESW